MRKILMATSGVVLCAAAGLAAADIPTRYSGSFPSTANMRNISGTFTGAALRLRGTIGARGLAAAGQYACSTLSPKQTRCTGTLKSLDGTYSDRHVVTITWTNGQPVAMSGSH